MNPNDTNQVVRRTAGWMLAAAAALSLLCGVAVNKAGAQKLARSRAEPPPADNRPLSGRPRQQHGGAGAILPVTLIDGVLTVIGFPDSETIHVSIAGDALLENEQITLFYSLESAAGGATPVYALSYPLDDVSHIFLMLGEGNDTFVNFTEVDCTVYGGPGGDLLVGGDSADSIYGEEGGDILFGGGGPDYVVGGPQSDVLCGGTPFGSAVGQSLIDLVTLELDYGALDNEWVYGGYHVDYEVDTLRGGPEDPNVDADWFLMEVVPDDFGNPEETDIAVDFKVNFDWATFNGHFWE